MFKWWRRDRPTWKMTPPAPTRKSPLERGWLHWSTRVYDEREAFRAAPQDLVLVDAIEHPLKYLAVLGLDGYRELLLPLLQRARIEAFKCAIFKGDRQPQDSARLVCDDYTIEVADAPGGAHRSVLWSQPAWGGGRLWIDGREIAFAGETPLDVTDTLGDWIDANTYATWVHGPLDHPLQDIDFGSALGTIHGLLVVDAVSGRHHIVQPAAHEAWNRPALDIVDGRWHIRAEPKAVAAGAPPDRVMDPPW
jgi:hypothetical protein